MILPQREHPEAWPPLAGWNREPIVRRKGVSGFPYGVVYVVRAEEIVILAYAHDRRRPGYWEHRLSS